MVINQMGLLNTRVAFSAEPPTPARNLYNQLSKKMQSHVEGIENRVVNKEGTRTQKVCFYFKSEEDMNKVLGHLLENQLVSLDFLTGKFAYNNAILDLVVIGQEKP